LPKLNPKRRRKVTVYLDEELHNYFLGLLYSHTEDRIKYGFSDLCNALLWTEHARQVAAKAAAQQAQLGQTS